MVASCTLSDFYPPSLTGVLFFMSLRRVILQPPPWSNHGYGPDKRERAQRSKLVYKSAYDAFNCLGDAVYFKSGKVTPFCIVSQWAFRLLQN